MSRKTDNTSYVRSLLTHRVVLENEVCSRYNLREECPSPQANFRYPLEMALLLVIR